MRIIIFLITGACCSGKSFFVPVLKDRLMKLKVKIHDFDEKIIMSNKDAIEEFLDLAKDYNKSGFFIIICGGITPPEIKSAKNYNNTFIIHSCLLNVEDKERKKRLLLRNERFYTLANTSKLPKDEFIQQVIASSKKYKYLIKESDSYIEIDNTINFNDTTIDKVCFWIKSKIG